MADLKGPKPTLGLSLLGFKYSYRHGLFDWRLLHGIDVDAVVRLTDVQAIEDCLDTLQHGSLESEKGLSSKNCVQLYRLLQLAIEYLWHLRNAHTTLLKHYQEAAAAAERWKAGARLYLDTGNAFITSCMHTGDIGRAALDTVDDARRNLEEQDARYNEALDRLEDEDQRARYFHFRKQRTELMWAQLHSVELDDLMATNSTSQLDTVLPGVVFGSIVGEDREELTPHHFAHLIPLGQCCLDYMLFQANATGAALEAAMGSLQGACAEIPLLTTSTQDLHARITSFILEAQQQAAQLAAGVDPATASTGALAPYPMGAGMVAAPPAPFLQGRPTSTFSRPGTAMSGGLGFGLGMGMGAGQGQPQGVNTSATFGSTTMASAYEEALALAQSGAMVPAMEMQTRAAELQFKVEALEQDLRIERSRTDEMRRLLGDIRGWLNTPQPPPSMPMGPFSSDGGGPGMLSPGPGILPYYSVPLPQMPPLGPVLQPGVVGFMGPQMRPDSPFAAASSGSPTKVKLYINEDQIRIEERQKTIGLLQQHVESMKAQWMRQHTLDRGGPQRGVSSSQNPGVAGMGERSSMVRRDRADRIRQSSSQIGERSAPNLARLAREDVAGGGASSGGEGGLSDYGQPSRKPRESAGGPAGPSRMMRGAQSLADQLPPPPARRSFSGGGADAAQAAAAAMGPGPGSGGGAGTAGQAPVSRPRPMTVAERQMAGEVGLSGGGGTGPGLKKSTSEAAMAAAHRRSQSSGSTVAQRLAAQQQKLVAGLERFQAQQQQLQQQRRLSGGQIPSDLE